MNVSAAVLAGLGAMFGWGTSDFLAAVSSRRIGNLPALFWMTVGTLILIVPSLIIFPLGVSFSFGAIITVSLVGFLQAFGALFFYRALEIGKVSLVSPVASSYSAWTVILSFVILKERLMPIQLIAVVLTICGVILVSLNVETLIREIKFITSDPGVKLSFLTSLFWGASYTAYKPVTENHGWALSLFFLYLFITFWLFIYAIVFKRKITFTREKQAISLLALMSLTNLFAWFSYTKGIEKNFVSIVSPVASAFPLVVIILARVFFKERLVWSQMAGIGAIIGGLILLAM